MSVKSFIIFQKLVLYGNYHTHTHGVSMTIWPGKPGRLAGFYLQVSSSTYSELVYTVVY